MARLTVDVEQLMVGLYQNALATYPTVVSVKSAPDVDAVEYLPMVVISPVHGAMIQNGAPGLGWLWLVEVTILAEGHAAAADLADEVYRQTHMFEDRGANVPSVGQVGVVEDNEMPRRVAKSIELNNLTQFTGSFQLVILPF